MGEEKIKRKGREEKRRKRREWSQPGLGYAPHPQPTHFFSYMMQPPGPVRLDRSGSKAYNHGSRKMGQERGGA